MLDLFKCVEIKVDNKLYISISLYIFWTGKIKFKTLSISSKQEEH